MYKCFIECFVVYFSDGLGVQKWRSGNTALCRCSQTKPNHNLVQKPGKNRLVKT